jgi:hypothetical protein
LAQGHFVTALVHQPSARQRLEQVGVSCIEADLFDPGALERAARGYEAIVNLATHMPVSSWKILFRNAWRTNDRIRTEGVANLVAAALRCDVGTLIQESFALAYPDRGDRWIDERTALVPAAYNKTVLDAEASVNRFSGAGRTGVVLRSVRPPIDEQPLAVSPPVRSALPATGWWCTPMRLTETAVPACRGSTKGQSSGNGSRSSNFPMSRIFRSMSTSTSRGSPRRCDGEQPLARSA